MDKYLAIIFVLLLSVSASATWDHKILRAPNAAALDLPKLAQELSSFQLVVMGEKHYTAEVQKAEAEILLKTSGFTVGSNHYLGWEFLNATTQQQNLNLYSQFFNGSLSAVDFLKQTQGIDDASVYSPVLDAIKGVGGLLYGLNLTRIEKAPAVQGGLKAVDPKLIPPNFEMGSASYQERFSEVMVGHATSQQLQNYFEAQCLTDDVMAFHIVNDYTDGHKFVVAGSFHTDYYDGTINRIHVRAPNLNIATIKIVDSSDYAEGDLLKILKDSKYGPIADYVFFVNEPQPAAP